MKEMKQILNVLETEKTGIIVKFVDGKPVFLHRMFAEYFAALWLSENYQLLRNNVEYLYSSDLNEIRYFFEEILSEGNPLHKAVVADSIFPILAVLCEADVDVEKEDKGGRRALHLAATNGNERAVRALLVKGADLRAIDKVMGWTPLRYSWMMMGERDIVYPFNMKYTERYLAVAEQFLQRGMEPNDILKLYECKEIVNFAIRMDYPLIAKAFIENDKLIRQDYMHTAAEYGSGEVMRILLEMGFNVNEKDEYGHTPLHIAARYNQWDAFKILMKNGANLMLLNNAGQMPKLRPPAQYPRTPYDHVICQIKLQRETTKSSEFSSGDEDDDDDDC